MINQKSYSTNNPRNANGGRADPLVIENATVAGTRGPNLIMSSFKVGSDAFVRRKSVNLSGKRSRQLI